MKAMTFTIVDMQTFLFTETIEMGLTDAWSHICLFKSIETLGGAVPRHAKEPLLGLVEMYVWSQCI